MIIKVFDLLSANGIDTYFIGQHKGECLRKYVVLKDAGAAKIQVIKVIREITGLGLVEAKGVADNGGNIKENVSVDEANEIKAKLEEAGATVELA